MPSASALIGFSVLTTWLKQFIHYKMLLSTGFAPVWTIPQVAHYWRAYGVQKQYGLCFTFTLPRVYIIYFIKMLIKKWYPDYSPSFPVSANLQIPGTIIVRSVLFDTMAETLQSWDLEDFMYPCVENGIGQGFNLTGVPGPSITLADQKLNLSWRLELSCKYKLSQQLAFRNIFASPNLIADSQNQAIFTSQEYRWHYLGHWGKERVLKIDTSEPTATNPDVICCSQEVETEHRENYRPTRSGWHTIRASRLPTSTKCYN